MMSRTTAILAAGGLLVAASFVPLIAADGPLGVCCEPIGGCTGLYTPAECEDLVDGGYWIKGDSCDLCGTLGACCLPDGTCLEAVTFEECAPLHPLALWNESQTCEQANCAHRGACCRENGECAIETAGFCQSPRIYRGDGTTCDGSTCPLGSCCTYGYPCLEGTEAECAVIAGEWTEDSTCADANGNGIPDACQPCPSDINGDGFVNVSDFLHLIAEWGPCN
ncbi:MAG: hypothetical protein ACYSVY_18390 [Planctomycetota bacterium]|jgi:hypothetical protein